MNTVVGSKFQKRIRETQNETHSPGTGTVHVAMGIIMEVYDQEKLQTMTQSADLKRKLENAPGLLFAKVFMSGTGKQLILPFKYPEDFIYLVYGNGFLLLGKTVKIEWQGMSIDSGVIDLARSWDKPHIHLPRDTNTLDIGNIL